MRHGLKQLLTIAGILTCHGAFGADNPVVAPHDVVYLSIREPNLRTAPPTVGMLFRELARQAFLIAARDECGVATRDKCLREEPTFWSDAKSHPFELQLIGKSGPICQTQIFVTQRKGAARQTLWEGQLEIPLDVITTGLVEKCEGLSRTDFKDLLRREGYQRAIPHSRLHSAVPKEVEEQLAAWNRIAAFRALRVLHAEIRDRGESPELLAALADAYANLGVLTECDWSPAHKAFKARALLYAERLVHESAGSALALAHRAYVRALVGMHAAAAADVKGARERQGKIGAANPLPTWLETIDLYCQGKLPQMVQAANNEPARSLARMLELLAFEPTTASYEVERSASAMLEIRPECFRAVNARCEAFILGVTHRAIPQMRLIFRQSMNRRLADVPALPEALRKRIESAKDFQEPDDQATQWADLIERIQEAGHADRGEPSMSVLGSLVQEMAFLLVRRRLEYEGNMLAVPTMKTVAELRPLVQHHPYGPAIEFYTTDEKERGYAGWLIHEVDYKELGFAELPALDYIYGDKYQTEMQSARNVVSGHSDLIYRDMLLRHRHGFLVRTANEQWNQQAATFLRSVSPNMPAVIALLIDFDWKSIEPRAEQLERQYADAPLVLPALGEKYVSLGRHDDAVRCFKEKIRAAPDIRSYRRLAEVYKQKGDMQQWKETLEKGLEFPSLGLEDTQMRVEIAEYHMKRNEWREALPYADAAAVSYAAYALLASARCHEMLGDWTKAEELVRAEAKRYEFDSFQWMLWCYRTGHGDAEAAKEHATHFFESLGAPAPVEKLNQIATYYHLSKQPEKAIAVYKELYEKQHNPFNGLQAALLADVAGNTKERDSLLIEIAGNKKGDTTPDRLAYVRAAQLMRDVLAKGENGAGTFDDKTVGSLIQKLGDGEPTNWYYFIGMFLQNRGEREKSREYLMRSATSPMRHKYAHVLARCALRDAKVAIGPSRAEERVKP